MDNGSLHIVMLPWLAMGHLIPFLELSKRLAQKGHLISFISTPKNIQKLPQIPPHLSSLINLIQFPLPNIKHLPGNIETTIDIPSDDLRPYLKAAFDGLKPHLSTFLEDGSHPPADWIIYDYTAHWIPLVAAESGVPCAYFGLFSAAVLGFLGPPESLIGDGDSRRTPEEFTAAPKWVPFPSAVAYRPYEARELFRPAVLPDEFGVTESFRFGAAIQGAQFVALRSSVEFEPEWIQLVGKLYQKPIVPIGLLPPIVSKDGGYDGWENTFKWLDKHQPGSVVYAAFGSEAKLTVGQIMEIAKGLETSRLPFVWAMRDGPPEGLDDRIKGQGLVCQGWVPQARILAHPSVGGFLTHGGWNSIVEGLSFGLAVVLLPLIFDQGLNARSLAEKGIGVEVPRNEEDGSFTGDWIARTLRMVMVEEEGEGYRAKARECKKLFGDEEIDDRCIGDFVKYLRENKQNKSVPKSKTV